MYYTPWKLRAAGWYVDVSSIFIFGFGFATQSTSNFQVGSVVRSDCGSFFGLCFLRSPANDGRGSYAPPPLRNRLFLARFINVGINSIHFAFLGISKALTLPLVSNNSWRLAFLVSIQLWYLQSPSSTQYLRRVSSRPS